MPFFAVKNTSGCFAFEKQISRLCITSLMANQITVKYKCILHRATIIPHGAVLVIKVVLFVTVGALRQIQVRHEEQMCFPAA